MKDTTEITVQWDAHGGHKNEEVTGLFAKVRLLYNKL